MNVVLSGYYGFENVGDEAILYSIIQALRTIQPDIHITVLSNNPTSTKKTYGVDAVNRWNIKEVNHAIKHSDGLISGGGSLLQDQTSLKTIPYYTGIIKIAKWHRKPVFIYAQGMGPFNHTISKFLVKRALKNVTITVRDTDSKQLLESVGISREIVVVPDPVIGLDAEKFENDWIQKKEISKPFITVSVRDWPTKVPFKEKIANSLDEIIRSGREVVFIPMHGSHDEKTSLEIVDMMEESALVAPATLSIQEKISIIGQSNALLGMRLHSLIFAAINFTPFIAISYDPKIDSFSNICSQPVVGHVENDDWDSDTLLDSMIQTLKNENSRQELLKNKMLSYQKEAMETAKLALSSFKKG